MSTGHKLVLGLLLAVCLALRVIALDAGPPPWLSWSMGVQTDEGFYTLDARHEALFGGWAPGNFHDRLVSPLLSALQQEAFRGFGVGTVQARSISVAFGLLTLIALWLGLRLACDSRVATWGALLLGLAPPVVFYNRMALQETPTVFWLVLAFTLWAAATGAAGSRRTLLLTLSGVSFAAAVMFKALALFALPALLVAWRGGGPKAESRRPAPLAPPVLGAGGTLALYLALWYVPHHAELVRMAAYYRTHQFMPHSGYSVWLNVRRGLADADRGVVPCLLRFLPLPCLFALLNVRQPSAAIAGVLAVWLGGGLTFCLLSSYAPDRYYVLFYPALAALAALGAARLPRSGQIVGLALFLATSGFWYARAWAGRDFARRDAGRALVRALPPGSMLVGEMAPALALDTPFAAAPTQPGLSNDDRPVERLRATHILVTRAPNQRRWWQERAPASVQPSHLLITLPLRDRNGDIVDVYTVKRQER